MRPPAWSGRRAAQRIHRPREKHVGHHIRHGEVRPDADRLGQERRHCRGVQELRQQLPDLQAVRRQDSGDGGLYLFTKIDHIRGLAKDDHAQVELTLGPGGEAESWRAHMQIQGNPKFDTGLVTSAAAFGGPKYAAIANVASKVLNSLSDFVGHLSEHGGRAAFPNASR